MLKEADPPLQATDKWEEVKYTRNLSSS